MSIRVAIPVHFASLTMYLEKGRRWSVVEHMLLYAVCNEPMSATELASESRMEIRLVIEVMIRLMRAGWVEIESNSDGMKFQATAAGKSNVDRDELPVITSPKKRKASFVIELVTGSIFRARDLTLYNRHRYTQLKDTTEIIELPAIDVADSIRQDQIIATLLNEDEECKHVEAVPGRYGERFALVSVIGSEIEGLPVKASKRLKHLVSKAAEKQKNKVPAKEIEEEVGEQKCSLRKIKFNIESGFIVGAAQHSALFSLLIKKAQSRIIIHSTFIDPERFRNILPLLHDAARRGVKIDILHGKNDTGADSHEMQAVLIKCRDMIKGDDVKERITFHPNSTNSHSKILVVDNGKGKISAILGSCNWLSTGFSATEASVRLEDPIIVSELIGHLGRMASGPNIEWTKFSSDLAIQSANLLSTTNVITGVDVEAQLVFASEHSRFVRQARDEATKRIVITSHRFSQNAETLILRPTKAAIKANEVDVKLYYGKLDGEGNGATAAAIAEIAKGDGIKHEQIRDPNLHAKILAWDDDSVVVSSQNWLSADPSDNDMYSEIGVFLTGSNVAEELLFKLIKEMPHYN